MGTLPQEELRNDVAGVLRRAEAGERITVTRALERERRRAVAARDVEILVRSAPDTDMATSPTKSSS